MVAATFAEDLAAIRSRAYDFIHNPPPEKSGPSF
jgi:hypothetical protein